LNENVMNDLLIKLGASIVGFLMGLFTNLAMHGLMTTLNRKQKEEEK